MKFIRFSLLFMLITGQAPAQVRLPALLEKLKRASPDTNKVLILKSLAQYYRNVKPDSAAYYAQQGLELSARLNFPYGKGVFNRVLGELAMNQGKMEEAKRRFSAAFWFFEQAGRKKERASIHNGFGALAIKQGNYTEATRRFLLALQIFEQLRDTTGIIQAYIKLGVLSQQNKDLAKALTYFNQGIALDRRYPPTDQTGTLMNNVGTVYYYQNDLRTALGYFKGGLKVTTRAEWSDVRILLLSNAGSCYQKLGDLTEAARYERQALQLIRGLHLKEYEINALVSLADVYRGSKPDSSKLLLIQALKISKGMNQRYLMLDVYQGMVDLYKKTGDYRAAEEALEKKNQLQDSLFTLKKAKDIAGLQSSYELAKTTIKLQRSEINNQHMRNYRDILLAAAIGVSLALLIFIFFYIRIRRLNDQMTRSKAILTQQKLELYKLNTFKDRLFSIIGHDLRSPIATIVNLMEVAEDNELSEAEFRSFVPQLKDQSKATLEVLDKLLLWGKSRLKGNEHNQSGFNARELILKNIAFCKNAALEKTISLIDLTAAAIMVHADSTQVDFIIRNLLANAVKFTHKGGRIAVNAVLNEPAGFHTIQVEDNGLGIAKELQAYIFEPANQSLEGTALEKGNSIGLMLCKEFAEENKGRIEVQSELGAGTRFSVILPAF